MLVDLGGGTLPHPRASVVIDLHHPRNSPAQDASITPWRVESARELRLEMDGSLLSGSADEIYSSHFMEHIHRGQPLINVMNEAWRVLKPGGTYTMIFPVVGFTNPVEGWMGKRLGDPMSDHIGWQPWSDPTHVNYWWLPEAIHYFCQGAFAPHADYGLKIWGPLGPYIDQAEATRRLEDFRTNQAPSGTSWWSIRDTWEGVVRIYKP